MFRKLFKLTFFAFVLLVISIGYRFFSGEKSKTVISKLSLLNQAQADIPEGCSEGAEGTTGTAGDAESNDCGASCW